MPNIRISISLTNEEPLRRSGVRSVGWDVCRYLIVPFRYHIPK